MEDLLWLLINLFDKFINLSLRVSFTMKLMELCRFSINISFFKEFLWNPPFIHFILYCYFAYLTFTLREKSIFTMMNDEL